jgi:hypothetical protein
MNIQFEKYVAQPMVPGAFQSTVLYLFVGDEDFKEWYESIAKREFLIVKTKEASSIPSFGQKRVDKNRIFKLDSTEKSWHELIEKIKDLIGKSISDQLALLDEQARKLEQQRMMPGWNYCQYFTIKESLASVFEMLNLLNDSLSYYDELEALFTQTMSEQGAPWFKRFGGEGGIPDIFNLNDKQYKEMIAENTITIYDFRMYLISRQCSILLQDGNWDEILKRSREFIEKFSITLGDYICTAGIGFKQAWIIVMISNILSKVNDDEKYRFIKAEMLLLSLSQVLSY